MSGRAQISRDRFACIHIVFNYKNFSHDGTAALATMKMSRSSVQIHFTWTR